jgi:hypothetical protein
MDKTLSRVIPDGSWLTALICPDSRICDRLLSDVGKIADFVPTPQVFSLHQPLTKPVEAPIPHPP